MSACQDHFADLFPPLAWEMPLALIAVDKTGRLRYANPATGRLLSGPASAFVGRDWSELVRGVDFPPSLPCDASLRRECGDAVAVRLKPCQPAPAGLVAFYAEPSAVSKSAAVDSDRLRLLVDHNPDIILVVGRDLKVRECNRVAPPLTREEVLGTDILSFLDPKTRAETLAKYQEVWRTGQPIDIETPVALHGNVQWFLTRLVPLPDPEGGPDGLLMVSRDVTELKRTEEALRESESRFRQIGEVLEDILWMCDMPGDHIRYMSRATESIWGIPVERMQADRNAWVDAIHPEDRQRVINVSSELVTGDRRSFDFEFRIVRPDGEIRWVQNSGVVLRDEQGTVYRTIGVLRDVTARKRLEANQTVLERRLQEARHLESLGVLAGGIAHDFNNFLSGILGNVNLAQLDVIHPAVRDFLDAIEQQTLRASELCKQMLAYAGKNHPRLEQVDLDALVDETARTIPTTPGAVEVVVERAGNLPTVPGDVAHLRQAILNIALNAAESFAGRRGTIWLTTGTKMIDDTSIPHTDGETELAPGRYVSIEIRDDGPGMTPEVLARVFEPFFTTKFAGRGLGLSAVHGIVRSHKGAIRIASRRDVGTLFLILLPTADVAPRGAAKLAPIAGGGEILLVDDEEIVRTTLAQMLQVLGFRVRSASDGIEGIARFRERPADLRAVLVDHAMPEMSGDAFVRELRQLDPRIPIVLMTGHMVDDLQHRFVDLALAGILAKPFGMQKLEAVLRSALAGA